MHRSNHPDQFSDIKATELYCPKCKTAQPVRERLLLVLPDGNLHDYSCNSCGASLGQRTESIAGNLTRQRIVSSPTSAGRRR